MVLVPMGLSDDGVIIISCAGHHISNILMQRSSMPDGPGIAEAEAYGWIWAGSSVGIIIKRIDN